METRAAVIVVVMLIALVNLATYMRWRPRSVVVDLWFRKGAPVKAMLDGKRVPLEAVVDRWKAINYAYFLRINTGWSSFWIAFHATELRVGTTHKTFAVPMNYSIAETLEEVVRRAIVIRSN